MKFHYPKGMKSKKFVLKNKPIIQQFVAQEMEIPQTFFEDNFICCGCGEIFEKATYAIAQNALGHSVVYKCDCGHKTVLK